MMESCPTSTDFEFDPNCTPWKALSVIVVPAVILVVIWYLIRCCCCRKRTQKRAGHATNGTLPPSSSDQGTQTSIDEDE